MPDRTLLKTGDRIRLLRVPAFDLEKRERELRDGVEDAGWTANTIERILRHNPMVVIDRIDEYGNPWFDYKLVAADGTVEEHFLAIMEDETWSAC
jgi:hypothetical protein